MLFRTYELGVLNYTDPKGESAQKIYFTPDVDEVVVLGGDGARVRFVRESDAIARRAGDDIFAFDDIVTRDQVQVNGEHGADLFTVGQLYNSMFMAEGKVVAGLRTTVGYLSNGCTSELTLNGGLRLLDATLLLTAQRRSW